jgi:hypothetical protein
VNIEHITKEMIKEHNIITFGMYRNEGIDLIEINDEMMLNYFKLFPSYEDYDGCTENFVFYKVIKSGNDGLIFNKSELSENEEYTILNEDVDYNCCRNLDDLFDLYQRDINKEDRKKYIDRMIRQNKFERILKK